MIRLGTNENLYIRRKSMSTYNRVGIMKEIDARTSCWVVWVPFST
jgi:hypothetical protein